MRAHHHRVGDRRGGGQRAVLQQRVGALRRGIAREGVDRGGVVHPRVADDGARRAGVRDVEEPRVARGLAPGRYPGEDLLAIAVAQDLHRGGLRRPARRGRDEDSGAAHDDRGHHHVAGHRARRHAYGQRGRRRAQGEDDAEIRIGIRRRTGVRVRVDRPVGDALRARGGLQLIVQVEREVAVEIRLSFEGHVPAHALADEVVVVDERGDEQHRRRVHGVHRSGVDVVRVLLDDVARDDRRGLKGRERIHAAKARHPGGERATGPRLRDGKRVRPGGEAVVEVGLEFLAAAAVGGGIELRPRSGCGNRRRVLARVDQRDEQVARDARRDRRRDAARAPGVARRHRARGYVRDGADAADSGSRRRRVSISDLRVRTRRCGEQRAKREGGSKHHGRTAG